MHAAIFGGRLGGQRASRLRAYDSGAFRISASPSHTLIAKSTHIDAVPREGAVRRLPIAGARALAAGFHFGWATAADGAFAWGADARGQTTVGDYGRVRAPVDGVAAGIDHAVVLAGGEVLTCGCACVLTVNTDGQLGRTPDAYSRSLERVDGIAGRVVRVRAGGDTSAAVTDAGSVWVWGNAEYGQALCPAADRIPAPVRGELAADAGKVVDVAVGGSFILLLNGTSRAAAANDGVGTI